MEAEAAVAEACGVLATCEQRREREVGVRVRGAAALASTDAKASGGAVRRAEAGGRCAHTFQSLLLITAPLPQALAKPPKP